MQQERLVVFGGAGCGKTSYLLDLIHKETGKVLVLSFSKAAKEEFSARLKRTDSSSMAFNIEVATVHSFLYKENLKGQQLDFWSTSKLFDFSKTFGYKVSRKETDVGGGFDIEGGFLGLRSLLINQRREEPKAIEEACYKAGLPFQKFTKFLAAFESYKLDQGLIDFDDIIKDGANYVSTSGEVLVVDEAQDLTLLEWQALLNIARGFKRVVLAGDDDQTIYSFRGAYARGLTDYLNMFKAQKVVLPKSFRLPENIFNFSQKVIHKVKEREKKDYTHNGKRGAVFHSKPSVIQFNSKDDAMILARTDFNIEAVETMLCSRRVHFTPDGRLADKYIEAKDQLGALSTPDEDRSEKQKALVKNITRHDGRLLKGARFFSEDHTSDPLSLLVLPKRLRRYFETFGYKYETPPKLRLNTIHGAKGKEASKVFLLSNITSRVDAELRAAPDNEHRLFYVGCTRAKEELYIMRDNKQQGSKHYEFN